MSLTLSARRHGRTVDTWLDEPTLGKHHRNDNVTLRSQRVPVILDAYFLLDQGNEDVHHCFAELALCIC